MRSLVRVALRQQKFIELAEIDGYFCNFYNSLTIFVNVLTVRVESRLVLVI